MGKNILTKISNAISKGLEKAFNRYGQIVATHPYIAILGCVFLTALCCIGFMNFTSESRPEKLWIPQDSDYVQNVNWQKENFPQDRRVEFVIFEAENILTKENIVLMYEFHQVVHNITGEDRLGNERTYEELCLQIPLTPPTSFKCLELTLLQLWEDNPVVINNLTDESILDTINTKNISNWFNRETDFISLLGEIERDESNNIISARTALHQWVMNINRTELDLGFTVDDSGAEEQVDRGLFDWEGEFLKIFLEPEEPLKDLYVFVQAGRSFSEVAGETILGDVAFLSVGILVLFAFVLITLGKFNWVETRPILSLFGLISCGMAIAMSFGLCSAFGIAYGPVHSILPLLLIGIGVDDMFVTVQTWENLNSEEQMLTLQEKIGKTLGHAGVAITVTSMTDFLAFIIGASTVLPALQSFCIYCALGIIALYFLQATFFVAWFSIDQSRLEKNKNGLIWCYTHKNYVPNKCSQNPISEMFFSKFYGKLLLKTPVKVIVLIVSCVLLGLTIWGTTTLKQEFDPLWFIPPSTYVSQFFQKLNDNYPSSGYSGSLYFGELDYPNELQKISILTNSMKNSSTAEITTITSWADDFCDSYNIDCTEQLPENFDFDSEMKSFLFSPEGSEYQSNFNFDGDLDLVLPLPKILASRISYNHALIDGRDERIEAMDMVKELVSNSNFSEFASAISESYSNWETDKIIAEELIRNLLLALMCVFIMTVILIANVVTSLLVLLCVALTLVDVMALMSWWDLTVDTVSCINLVVSIGLCVDYSAHVALHFMQVTGSRDERVYKTLKQIGPAVLNGAFSTFLSFILLAGSDSHVFTTFFKVFFGVFIFGVFHGLVFLPVILSIIGPQSYIWLQEEENNQLKRGKLELSRSSTSLSQYPMKSSL